MVVVAGDARLRFLYRFLYNGWRYICHSLRGLAVSQVWDAWGDAFVVGPGVFDDVIAWVSGWVGAASAGAVGPALAFVHGFSCSGGGGGRGNGDETLPPPHPALGGSAGNLSGAEFANVHSQVAAFLEGFYNGGLYFCPAYLVGSGAAADAVEECLGFFLEG